MVTAKMFATIQKTTSSENRSLLSAVQTNLKTIHSQTNALKQRQNYSSLKASSTDIKILHSKPTTEPLSVTIKKLATAQSNQSPPINPSDSSLISSSSFSFTLKTLDKSQSFTVNLEGTRSNKEVYGKIAEALNTSGTVTASLIHNKNQVSLKITSMKTGKENAFDITGDDATALGLTTITDKAEDGVVEINGETIEQSSNTYTQKAHGLTFEANSVTEEPIKLTTTLDVKTLTQDFRGFTDALNQLTSTFESKGQSIATEKIKAGYTLLKPQLEALGIKLDTTGLKLDSERLVSQLQQNPDASRTLSQFASISSNAIKTINPTTLLTDQLKKTYDNSDNTPYYLSNLGNIIDNNPYKGSLLDMLV
jgi:flagellar capping protein FliD